MRKEKISSIEEVLSQLLLTLSTDDYLKLINDNECLKKYDEIAAKVENGDYPSNYLDQITDNELDNIILYLNKKSPM